MSGYLAMVSYTAALYVYTELRDGTSKLMAINLVLLLLKIAVRISQDGEEKMHLKDGMEGKNLLSSQFLVHGKKEHVARQHGVAYRCQDLWQLFDAVFVALIHLRYLHFYGTVRKSCYCQDVIRA